jgi:AcrR family transcriptional regulator
MTPRAPRRLGRPPAIDSAETRQKILDAARRAFARKGYDATTNKHIADDVGITTGAIYHYFASKADLYVAVYEEVQAMIYEIFEKAVAPYETFPGRVAAALDAAVQINQRDASIAGFVVGVPDERARHEHLGDRIAQLQSRSRTFFGGLVEEAIEQGEISPDTSAEAVSDMLTAITTGLARFSTQAGPRRHRKAADALKQLIDGTLIINGGRARGATAAP